MIPRQEFGRTGHQSTRVIFGSWALSKATQAEADRALGPLQEYGVNHIDTAPMYGNAEKVIGPYAYLDVGIMVQTIALVAQDYGLGTCPTGRVVYYPDIIREILHIPESKIIILAIDIGYPDPEALCNSYERHREPLDTFTHWYGF